MSMMPHSETLACPKCGQDDGFHVDITGTAYIGKASAEVLDEYHCTTRGTLRQPSVVSTWAYEKHQRHRRGPGYWLHRHDTGCLRQPGSRQKRRQPVEQPQGGAFDVECVPEMSWQALEHCCEPSQRRTNSRHWIGTTASLKTKPLPSGEATPVSVQELLPSVNLAHGAEPAD
jgi:hypothetical protein